MKNKTYLAIAGMFVLAAANSLAQPKFTTQPASQVVNQGFNATLRAVATTTAPPLSYQWYFDSNAIPEATVNTMTLSNTQPADAGNYFLVASDLAGSSTSRVATVTVTLPAALDPKISANMRVGEDPSVLPGGRRAQTESHLARSVTDPNFLSATFMEGSAADAALDCSSSISKDGGRTWSARKSIPKLTVLGGGTAPRAADPVSVVDASGNLFVAALSVNLAGDRSIDLFISKSSDGGESFGPPRSLFHADSRYWADKEWIAINTFKDSPTYNRIAVAFTRVDDQAGVGQFGQMICTYSDDGGATWSPLAPAGKLYATYAQPIFFRDGSLAIFYERANPNPSVLFVDECVLSKDGGKKFGEAVLVLSLTGLNYHDPAVFAYSDSSICSDRQAGALYMTVAALQGPVSRQIPQVLFSKSIDHGQTWTKPVVVNDTPGGASVFQPTIAASPDGQHITIAFYDKRNSAGKSYLVDYYLAESFDGGDHWEPNLRVSEFTIDVRKSPSVGDGVWLGDYQGLVPAVNFNTPAVATWIDTRAGNNDPYAVSISRTKGTTFETWRKLRFSTNDLANMTISSEDADPDHDGIPNLAEYAFGLEPTEANGSPLRISVNNSGPKSMVELSYERLAVLGDIQASWEESTNLVNWNPIKPEQEAIAAGSDPWMQSVAASFVMTDQRKFFRQRLTLVKPVQ